MAEPHLAVFGRGPRDGETMTLPDLPHVWLFPAPPPITYMYTTDDNADVLTEPPRVLVYELAYTYGQPSIDDTGHYRYQYRGTR